ncbi:MAG: trypsin-like peptidase domain-containing protein [Eubacteriales bacterium]|nr:trypsin-like peptidase domain-containing protein [Eubacteriales bacterium]
MEENTNIPDNNNYENNQPVNNTGDKKNDSSGWQHEANDDYRSAVYPQGRYQQVHQQSQYQYTNHQPHTQSYYQPPVQPQGRNSGSGRGAKIAGLVAVFLAGAILMSAITGIAVYKIMDENMPTNQQVTTTSLADDQDSTDSTDEVRDDSSDNDVAGEGTDKHFSIESASRRDDEGRTALSTMEIAAAGRPAVVAISTEMTMTDAFGRTGAVEAAGSGFIITSDGYIVTNFHVVAEAETITVTMESGEVSEAVLVGNDESNDLAVLKVDGENLPTVVLGDSEDLQIGELAVAIGNPLGRLSGTVTAGIISALDRTITIDGQSLSLLQTDAAINSGNSGGALFNSYGEVIGINTAKNAGTGVEGLGFAIPIDNAKPIIESLIQYGYVRGRSKLGIYTRDVTAQMAMYYQLPEGIYVVEIDNDGPAYEGGIRQGDIIIAADGQELKTTTELLNYRNSKKPGDVITFTVSRGGQEMEFEVILVEDIPSDVQQTSYSGQYSEEIHAA